MAYNPQRLKRAYYAFSSIFKKQSAFGTALADADLDERHNCRVTFEDVIDRETVYDCAEEDVADEEKNSQLKRVRLSYPSITPQRLYGWICALLSSTAGATGTPNDEVQTITIDATGGTFTVSFSYEGLSGTTPALAYNCTAAQLQAALEALESIGEGNVSVTKLSNVFTITFIGALAKTNVPALSTTPTLTGGAGTAAVNTTTPGGNKYHAATRSTDDQLAKSSMGCGWENNTDDPKKYRDLVVDSIVINFNRRRLLTVEVVLIGRFTPAEMDGFTVPDCVIPDGIKGSECVAVINSSYKREEFWSGTVTLNNAVPTGDDAFPFTGTEIANLERGDKPTYPIAMQILGSGRDTVGALVEDETKVPITFHFGNPGNRCSLVFPNVLMKFASNPIQYVGDRNRSAHNIEATPHKDETLQAPLRAEAYLDQTAQFLST